jgi:hypothetical protein
MRALRVSWSDANIVDSVQLLGGVIYSGCLRLGSWAFAGGCGCGRAAICAMRGHCDCWECCPCVRMTETIIVDLYLVVSEVEVHDHSALVLMPGDGLGGSWI